LKFTCDRCGKRFSSVDEPMPGRVYRIRCRCGNAIQISSPQLSPDGVPRRKGGMPLRDPGKEGSSSAMPPLPAGPRAATPAGDAGAPVRPAGAARTPAAVRAPSPSPPRSAVTAAAAVASQAANAATGHARATRASVLVPDPPSPSPDLDPAPRTGTTSRVSLPPPSPETTSSNRVPVARPEPLRERTPVPMARVGIPSTDDPFAAAAAHAARVGGDVEITAPVFRAARTPAAPPVPPALPPAVAKPLDALEVEAAVAAPPPQEDDETSIELSVSEQYSLPRQKKSGRKPIVFVMAAAALLAAGAGGAYVWSLRATTPTRTATTTATTAPAKPRPAPGAPSAGEIAKLDEARRDVEAERKAEAERKSEAERNAEADRKAEAERRASATRAQADRKAEVEQKAEARRRAEAEQKAEARRKADAERRAEAERKDAERKAEAERKARADRRVAFDSAPADGQKAKPAAPPVDPALAEALKRKEEAVAPRAQPLAEGLDPAEMQAVIRGNRTALEGCVARALADPATAGYAGRKVSLIILVAPNGRAEAALEEPELDASAFGACLRRVATKMTFPAFRGEPVGARIPLVLGRAD